MRGHGSVDLAWISATPSDRLDASWHTEGMRPVWLLVSWATLTILSGCDPAPEPGVESESSESGTDASETGTESGDGDGDGDDGVTQPLCDGPLICGDLTGEGVEEPSSQLTCHHEVLRDAAEPAWLRTASDNPDLSIRSTSEFLIDGTSRMVTKIYTRYTQADGMLLSRDTSICELQPAAFFQACLDDENCWPVEWVIGETCVPVSDCD
jgi:hypothetical protein